MTTHQRFDPLDIDTKRRTSVMRWIDLLCQWNARIDLTAARSQDELYDLMLADAAMLAKHVHASARVVDVGTGAGAPGLALALLRPDLKLTLVEPLRKRVAFLRLVVGTLERLDIEIVEDRGEAVANKRPRNWDVAISRATLGPDVWVPLGLRLALSAWAFVARDEPPSVAGAQINQDIAYTWPLTGVSRRAVGYVLKST